MSTLTPGKYVRLSVAEMAAGVRERRFSSTELTELSISLVNALQPKINCYSLLNFDQARAEAKTLDAEAKAGRFRGPLHGVPISVKDTYHVPGFRTGMGSNTYKDHVAKDWSPLPERVLGAGAVMLGKTAMPEFGWTAAALSPLTGHTRNPWNASLTPGGSSSGSAAAVAARIVPAALGGDGGGSIRIPASFCGVFGLKPSFGRIGVWPGSVHEQLVHHGFLSRTALDMAHLLEVGAGPHPRDPWSLPKTDVNYAQTTVQPVSNVRVSLMMQPWGIACDPRVTAVIEGAVKKIAASRGWIIKDGAMPMAHPHETFEVLWGSSRAYTSAPYVEQRKNEMDPDLVTAIRSSLRFTLNDYIKASLSRREFFSQAQSLFDDCDVIVMPTLPGLPFDVDNPPRSANAVLPWLSWAPFTFPFNLSGHPAASLPCGYCDGLPIGLQVIGPRFRDDVVLRVCHAIEGILKLDDRMPDMTVNAVAAASTKN